MDGGAKEALWKLEHYVKSRLGRDAMERIVEGDDCSSAVEKMDREWTDYCMAHAWD